MCDTVKFRPEVDIPDLSGKVIMVTGGNVGLGLETIRNFAQHHPAHIYLAARSQQKAEAAIQELKKTVPGAPPISFLSLDLSSFDSIKAAARTFNASETRLDILVNNAGIMTTPEGLTKEGYEVQFGTNHMGHALLTQLLLPTLQKTAETNPDVRVVILSSSGEQIAPSDMYKIDTLKTTMPKFSSWTRYGISKIANIHYTAAMAARYKDIKFVCVHPGIVKTNLAEPLLNNAGFIMRTAFRITLTTAVPVTKGVLNQLWASVSPDAKTGEFYHPVGLAGKGSRLSRNREAQEQLWNLTQEELKGHL